MHGAVLVRVQTVPLYEYVEQRHREGELCLEVSPPAMRDFLEMTDGGQRSRLRRSAGMIISTLAGIGFDRSLREQIIDRKGHTQATAFVFGCVGITERKQV